MLKKEINRGTKLETKSGLLNGDSSVSFSNNWDEEGILWLTLVYSPNKSNVNVEFWIEIHEFFGQAYPKWCVGGIFMS